MPLLLVALALIAAAPTPAYHLAGAIPGPDGGWDLLSVDDSGARAYVARGDYLMAVDLKAGTATKLAAATRAHAALAIPGSGEVLLTNGQANTAQFLDGTTGKVRATIPTGTKPDAATFDPASRHLFVMTPGDGGITVIDPVHAKAIATIPVGGSLELGAVDGHGRLFVNIEDQNQVAVIDTRANRVLRRFPLADCDEPTGIAYAPEAKRLVSACGNGKAIVSDTAGKHVATLAIGEHPDGAAYDARRHVALIPSGGSGTLAVIRLTGAPRVVQTLPTARGARTLALDPVSGRAYLPSAQYLPAQGKERPPMVPGSFRLLMVAP